MAQTGEAALHTEYSPVVCSSSALVDACGEMKVAQGRVTTSAPSCRHVRLFTTIPRVNAILELEKEGNEGVRISI